MSRNFQKPKADIVYGRNPVYELLKSAERDINKIYISSTAHGQIISQITELAKQCRVPVLTVPSQKLDALAPNSQGVVAEASAIKYVELDEMIDKTLKNERPIIVLLDGINDPHNLGAIIRNAAAFGAGGVVAGKWRTGGVNETVAKTSAGAAAHIDISRVSNINNAITLLKKRGFWTAAADPQGQDIKDCNIPFPIAVVFGSEGAGISKLIKNNCDFIIRIPQTSTISSLNVSCSSAIILYELSQKMGLN